MTQILSVSVAKDHAEWLSTHKKDKTCSVTFLLRQAISHKMNEIECGSDFDPKVLLRKIETLADRLGRYADFIERRGLSNEFFLEQAEK